ncbi:MAG: 2-amino-4-hydroxy-6-hydroxymethyldihydropteridine diphosphokinase [Thermodesulfobacteriota bacterium]
MPRVFIGIGSNLGDRINNCKKALSEIRGFSEIVRVSSVYETEPVGNEDQPEFINCAAEIETVLTPRELMERLHSVEDKLERTRGERWGPRTIDLDIIFYDDLIIDTDELTIPHVSVHTRRFVLEPICELDPQLVHPGFGVHVYELLNDLEDAKQVVKTGEPSTLFSQ